MNIKSISVTHKNPYPREKDIIKWGTDRSIYTDSTSYHQFGKLEEEVEELLEGIENRDRDEIKDAIGDIYVVLTHLAHMYKVSIDDCVEQAWEDIKDRKGKMVKGVFVKETI